jgi:hypothetical protein
MIQGGKLIVFLAVLLGLTLLGDPAPTALGPVEGLLLAGVVIATLMGLARARLVHSARIGPTHASILAALGLYCLSLLGTLAIGVLQGAPVSPALRAVGPYLLFLPLAAVGPWLSEQGMPRATVRALVVAGLSHAVFLLVLFVSGVQDILDLRSVFFGRTTMLDARTTVPLFLASAILPLAWLALDGRRVRQVLALMAILISTVGALSTQTRSQLLALAAGGLAFLPFYGVHWARLSGRPPSAAIGRVLWVLVLALLVTSTAVILVPTLRVLVSAVALRSRTDQDNGRLTNEWLPAVQRVSASPSSLALGIGAGQSFITGDGEPRTYVHNLAIYMLLYGGLLGVIATAILYLSVGALLARRALRERGLENAALLALLVALSVYAEFFAVHKLLSYNLMIALITAASVPPQVRAQAMRVSQ